ncbi:hypothetical protein [Neobacillus muris]|uniref:hypothetical protein n=1 Tax=Neobacillus muris TaxID=2941334 RepID=UPI00203BE6D3|nr:hypothetical protein [Neobacillus muris]
MNNSKVKYTFDFDERGTKEVSDQIMNSYNSGSIEDHADFANDQSGRADIPNANG